MSFFDLQVDFSDSEYSYEDYLIARNTYLQVFTDELAAWPDRPSGHIATLWEETESPHCALFLIHIAKILDMLVAFTSPNQSDLLRGKVLQLFREKTEEKFEDLLTELEVGAFIGEKARPIFLEPLASQASDGTGTRLRSPDYGLSLPEGELLLEVTRKRIAFIRDWGQSAQYAASRMQAAVFKNGLHRKIEFHAPLLSNPVEMSKLWDRSLLSRIVEDRDGEESISMTHGTASVAWSERVGFTWSQDVEMQVALDMKYESTYEESDISPRVVKSLNNSFKGKRKQMTAQLPYVLTVRVDEVNPDAVATAIKEQFFTNRDFSWMTGIVVFRPARNWHNGSGLSSLVFAENQNARYPMPHVLREVLRGRAEIHWGDVQRTSNSNRNLP